uniref:Uncharacterized protein n=1 Tax=Arundo donax TaxID=35708 RepID=A0A0A9FRD1_ARUDO
MCFTVAILFSEEIRHLVLLVLVPSGKGLAS